MAIAFKRDGKKALDLSVCIYKKILEIFLNDGKLKELVLHP